MSQVGRPNYAEVYSRAAHGWRRLSETVLGLVYPTLVATIDFPQDAIVLDVGTGTGELAMHAGRKVGRRGSVYGIDLSRVMVEIAHARITTDADASGVVNVDQADMDNLGLEPDTFHVVMAGFAVPYSADPVTLLKVLWNLLVPGGTLGLTAFDTATFEPVVSLLFAAIEQRRPDIRYRDPWLRTGDPEAWRELLRDSGISETAWTLDLRTIRTMQPMPEPDAEQARRDLIEALVFGTSLRVVMENLSASEQDAVIKTVMRNLADTNAREFSVDVHYVVASRRRTVRGRPHGVT